MPQEQLQEDTIKNINAYIASEISKMNQIPKKYISETILKDARDIAVCRLTLFNARRGGEPARLTIREYENAMNDQWLTKDDIEKLIDPIEMKLAESMKITYQIGKG